MSQTVQIPNHPDNTGAPCRNEGDPATKDVLDGCLGHDCCYLCNTIGHLGILEDGPLAMAATFAAAFVEEKLEAAPAVPA